MPFCPGTKRWDRTPDTEMPFCPRPRRFVPGQKGGTERLGQKGWDRTSGTEGLGQNVWDRRAGAEGLGQNVPVPSKNGVRIREKRISGVAEPREIPG